MCKQRDGEMAKKRIGMLEEEEDEEHDISEEGGRQSMRNPRYVAQYSIMETGGDFPIVVLETLHPQPADVNDDEAGSDSSWK